MQGTIIALIVVLVAAAGAFAQEAAAPDVFGGAHIGEIYRLRLDRGGLLLESLLDAMRTL